MRVPILRPESPAFTTPGERTVWNLLREQLRDEDLLLANLRITDRDKDYEIDIAVVLPGAAVVTVEVKGSRVWHDGKNWLQEFDGKPRRIRPVDQARDGKYALRSYVEGDPRWGSRGYVRWAHAVVLTGTRVSDDLALPDCPRWSILDRDQLDNIAEHLWAAATAPTSKTARPPDEIDALVIAEILAGRGLPQRDVVALALDREDAAQQLTEEQATILSATQLLHRVEVRGGAGSGKTWLALEQARRLGADGKRVAMLCYSRGLAEFLRRYVHGWSHRLRPAYVGEYHALGVQWGAAPGSDDDSEYWEQRLPAEMLDLAEALPPGGRFDAIVVDEAQDFADSWWPPLLASLKDPETGGLYVFSDEGQRVFARLGRLPVPLVPIVLDHNLRNTRQIAASFDPLTPMRMRLRGGDGPAVRLVECAAEDAIDRADDEVDHLLESGWRPEDVALLTTGPRHPQQVALQASGQAHYWASFWDTDQVFYGHVLGFKGLERRAVVLALNETGQRDRARERLYVGLSRARDELVVCGDPAWIAEVGGEAVLRRLRTGS